jgi:hypothetical protein
MNKYNKQIVLIDGREVDKTRRVFKPKEYDGNFTTTDGKKYQRDPKTGTIRRIK